VEPESDRLELTTDQWLAVAADAAVHHDGVRMVEALWASRLPQIVASSLCRKHRLITWEDAEDIVAVAVTELYEKIRKGGRVHDPRALLWTVAGRRAITFAVKRARTPLVTNLDERRHGESLTAFSAADRTPAEASARAEAIQKLRTYVARMGPGRAVTRLWRTVLDVIEDESSLTRDEVAERLDITEDYVSVLVHRGKKKLQEVLRADGMAEAAEMLDEWTLDAIERLDELDGSYANSNDEEEV